MTHTWKCISVYFNADGNLIGIPTTQDKKYKAIVDIDEILTLTAPYSDVRLERFIHSVFELCFSVTPEDIPKCVPLQKHLGVKGHSAAVKGLGRVALLWTVGEGYTITPTRKSAELKNAFVNIDDKAYKVDANYVDGELAKALRHTMLLSSIETKPKVDM
jgi:hypothetical protein